MLERETEAERIARMRERHLELRDRIAQPMPRLELTEKLGIGTLNLLEGTDDVYLDAAPIPK